MEYLTRWRMLLAGDRLLNASDPISVIALSLPGGGGLRPFPIKVHIRTDKRPSRQCLIS